MSRPTFAERHPTVRRRALFHHLRIPAALLGLASGCGSPPDREKVMETVRSWTATASLAADERRAEAITRRYAQGLVDMARTARAEAAQSLAAGSSSATDRVEQARALDSLDLAIGRLAATDPPR